MSFDTIASTPVGTRMLDTLVGRGFGTTRLLNQLSEAELYEVAFDAAFEVSSEKWSSWPEREWRWEDHAPVEAVERLADAVPACSAARWWSAAALARPQVWMGRVAAAPTAGVLAPNIVGKPRTEIWTSSAVEGLPSAWWPYLERRVDGPSGQMSIWRIAPHPEARVFEIRTPADWQWLCERFPGPDVDGWVAPGWEVVAEEFDGVHLTVEGLIRVQGVEIETDRGQALLENWDSESTAWLRWSVASLERLGTVTQAAQPSVTRGRESRRARRRS